MIKIVDISVIIPFFNVEEYIEKCLRSLISQEISDAEFIFVNDGSLDASNRIVEKYAQNDSRIVIVNKENGGLSSARNEGLKYVRGEYVLFLDSDDYLEPGALNRLVLEARNNQLDVLQAQYKLIYPDREEPGEQADISNVVMDGRTWLIGNQIVYGACFCLYKAEFLKNIGISFLEGVYHEDMEFLPKVMYQAERIMAIDYVFYDYVVRESSISNKKALKRCEDYYFIACHVEEWAKKNVDTETFEGFFKSYICFLYSHAVNLCVIQKIPIDEFLDVKDRREVILERLQTSKDQKYVIERGLLKYHFYRLYAWLYHLWNRTQKE